MKTEYENLESPSQPQSNGSKTAALVLSRLLASTVPIWQVTVLLWLVSLILFGVMGWLGYRVFALFGLSVSCVGMVALMQLQLRLQLDARLFADLSLGTIEAASMDEALLSLGLVKRIRPRTLSERMAGAMRLLRWFVGIAMGYFGAVWLALIYFVGWIRF